MSSNAKVLLAALSLGVLLFAGCLGSDDADETETPAPTGTDLDPVGAAYEAFVVSPAIHQGHGLYEPTIDVSPEGALYISSHSTGVGVGPSPSYVSTDDGATWAPMAFASGAATPLPQGAAPLFSDEIFIVAGDNGQAWGVDINLRDYIVAGWCAEGTELCYYNPNAYDHAEVVTSEGCTPVPLKDRPWAAYANNKLFLVNNPGGGPAQIGIMDVPPGVPAEAGPVVSGIEWNLCASSGGGIPGIPDIRDDGFFAVPQVKSGEYILVTGNASDIHDVREQVLFENSHIAPAESDSTPSQIGDYGQAVFDAEGSLFVGAMNNSAATEGPNAGGIHVAVSTDDGATFSDVIFRFDQPVSSIYLDGNKFGGGALLNWGQIDGENTDWYFGHLFVEDGVPVLRNVMLAFDDGPEASRHVQGAAAGPDGRAYMVMSDVSGNDDVAMAQAIGTTPLRVVVQQDGPTLPANSE